MNVNRQIAPGIHWLGTCREVEFNRELLHNQVSTYVIVGKSKTLMVDTGNPTDWVALEPMLDIVLGGRQLDWIVPTHSELPHSGNLPRLLRKYPKSRAIGDIRDYHLFYPAFEDRLVSLPKDQVVDLGGGYRFSLIKAVIPDLPASQWVYEWRERVMFTADGFGWVHHIIDVGGVEGTVHWPNECGMLSSELAQAPEPYQAARPTTSALTWARYRESTDLFNEVAELFVRYPTRLVAPTHGNVIADPENFLLLMAEAFGRVLGGAYRERGALYGESAGR